MLDGPLVAGKLNIPAEQGVGQPDQGIEPVDGQNQIAQRLPQVVFPLQVHPLMGNDMVNIRLGKVWGKIDPGVENAQDERGGDSGAEGDVIPVENGIPHPAAKPVIAEEGILQHGEDVTIDNLVNIAP